MYIANTKINSRPSNLLKYKPAIDIINNKETFCVNKTSLKSLQKALLRRGKTQLSPIVERKKTYMEGESIDKKESLRKCVNNKFRKKYNKSKSVLG